MASFMTLWDFPRWACLPATLNGVSISFEFIFASSAIENAKCRLSLTIFEISFIITSLLNPSLGRGDQIEPIQPSQVSYQCELSQRKGPLLLFALLSVVFFSSLSCCPFLLPLPHGGILINRLSLTLLPPSLSSLSLTFLSNTQHPLPRHIAKMQRYEEIYLPPDPVFPEDLAKLG